MAYVVTQMHGGVSGFKKYKEGHPKTENQRELWLDSASVIFNFHYRIQFKAKLSLCFPFLSSNPMRFFKTYHPF